ncbi:MAG: diguanylate cyclase [Clostridiaceae bacterium]
MRNIYNFLFEVRNNYGFIIVIILLILLIAGSFRYKKRDRKLLKLINKYEEDINRYKKIIDTIPDPVFCKNAEGLYTECNKEFEKALGLKREEIIGKSVFEITKDTAQANIYYNADLDLMNKKGTQIYETKFKLYDGSSWDAVYRKAAILSDNGECIGIVGVIIDITKVKIAERRIEKMMKTQEAFIQINHSMMDYSNVRELLNLILEKAISIVDGAEFGSILKLDENSNLEVVAYKDYDFEEAENFSLSLKDSFIWTSNEGKIKDIVRIDDIYKLNYELANVINSQRNYRIKSIFSAPIMIEENIYGILNLYSDKENAFLQEDIDIMKYIKTQVEIVIYKHMLYEEKIYLSRYDKLTNLYNRRYFEELYKFISETDGKKEKYFHIVVFDMNNLKLVNDNYGHIIGDQYIKAFSDELRRISSDSDIIARYGGDEFVGMFFNKNYENLRNTFEDSLRRLRENPVSEKLNVFLSFSYGIAEYPKDGETYSELISVADKKMYQYKKQYHIKTIN